MADGTGWRANIVSATRIPFNVLLGKFMTCAISDRLDSAARNQVRGLIGTSKGIGCSPQYTALYKFQDETRHYMLLYEDTSRKVSGEQVPLSGVA